jgi:integrase
MQWFYENDQHYFPFVSLHLYQSVRPSESAGLNWGRVDAEANLATIARSRNLGEENAPKTRAARRVIHLKSHVGAIIRSIKPLHAKDHTPVFVNKLGERIKPDQFRKDQWYRALRALDIRPDFYSCKDTAISLDITAGENAKKIVQEAGVSLSNA